MANYNANLGLKTDQAKFEQQLAQKAQIANNPILATQDIIDTYKKMGVMAGRSDQEILQSVQKDIAGGMTLGESLSNLNKAFQSKPTYLAAIAKLAGNDQTPTIQRIGGTTDNPVYGYFKNGVLTPVSGYSVSPSGGTTAIAGIPPSGQFSTETFSSDSQKAKSVTLDSSAMGAFKNAVSELEKSGVQTFIGSTTRSKEEQQKLYDAYKAGTGGIAAAPGTSKHGKGLGIDIYSDSKFSPPTQAQITAMESKGWKHMNIPGDLGHFEYVGGTSSALTGTPKQAYDTINGNINLSSLDSKARSAVTKYISDNDLVNGQTGNMKFLGETNTEKQGMAAMLKMKADLEALKAIPNITDYVGKYDAWSV